MQILWISRLRGAVCLCCILYLSNYALSKDVNQRTVVDSWLDDAELHDVMFVDDAHGWAVGDHGTIWHTENGGEIWRIQASPTTAPLRSVHFVDEQHGWAAGGEAVPLTQITNGVLLKTLDGGKTWELVEGLLLPWINEIHFSSDRRGIALGHASSTYPSGAWTTGDGGRTWSPLVGEQGVHWVQADFRSPSKNTGETGRSVNALDVAGFALGHDGRVARVSGRTISTTRRPSGTWLPTSCLAALDVDACFTGPNLAFSPDQGRAWTYLGLHLPPGVSRQTRVNTMVSMDRHLWCAGSPGNRILHSTNYGQAWQVVGAPSTLPLRKLFFASPTLGWAVGARGTILSTKDGGTSWGYSGQAKNEMLCWASLPMNETFHGSCWL